jgi:hypothetical protein
MPRLIRWVLLLQEYDLQIIDKRGKDNPVAVHLSRMEGIPDAPVPINESFPGEYLASVETKDPWYADYANYLAGKILPPHFTYHQRNKFFNDLKHYYWDEPHLYRHGSNGIIWRCILDHEIQAILLNAHCDPYVGHHAGIALLQRYFNQDFIGQLYLKMLTKKSKTATNANVHVT